MSDTPVVGKIAFSSVANPNAWDIGESKCLVFASPSEAKRAEELFSAMQRDLTAAQAKLSRVEAENATLRGLLGNSAKPCPHCGLAAEDQAKCAMGFPGCARADDQMLSKHFADAYRADCAEAERNALRVCLDAPYNEDKRARFHAERERDALKIRLEIDPAHPYDGIDCRDQTIKLLEERVDALKEIIYWALGERGEFPHPPENWDALKHKPWYWWRTELRARLDAARKKP